MGVGVSLFCMLLRFFFPLVGSLDMRAFVLSYCIVFCPLDCCLMEKSESGSGGQGRWGKVLVEG